MLRLSGDALLKSGPKIWIRDYHQTPTTGSVDIFAVNLPWVADLRWPRILAKLSRLVLFARAWCLPWRLSQVVFDNRKPLFAARLGGVVGDVRGALWCALNCPTSCSRPCRCHWLGGGSELESTVMPFILRDRYRQLLCICPVERLMAWRQWIRVDLSGYGP